MTPRAFYREAEAARQRWQDESERDLAQAWYAAAFTAQAYAGKLPPLQRLLDSSRMARGARSTLGEMKQALTNILGKPRIASDATLAMLKEPKGSHG